MKEDIDTGFKECESKLNVVSDPKLNENACLREEMHKFSGIFDADVDGKLDDIENQLSVILANIAEITLGYPVKPPQPIPNKKHKTTIPTFEFTKPTFSSSQPVKLPPPPPQENQTAVRTLSMTTAPQASIVSEPPKPLILSETVSTETPKNEPESPKVEEEPKSEEVEEKELGKLDEQQNLRSSGLVFNPNDFVIDLKPKSPEKTPTPVLSPGDMVVGFRQRRTKTRIIKIIKVNRITQITSS